MKYAVFKTGGKQYRVSEGQILQIEKIAQKPKEKVEFGEVLLLVSDGERQLGQPLLERTKVTAEVLEQIKGPKLTVAKFKAKVRYRRKIGYRHEFTKIKIEKISQGREKPKEETA